MCVYYFLLSVFATVDWSAMASGSRRFVRFASSFVRSFRSVDRSFDSRVDSHRSRVTFTLGAPPPVTNQQFLFPANLSVFSTADTSQRSEREVIILVPSCPYNFISSPLPPNNITVNVVVYQRSIPIRIPRQNRREGSTRGRQRVARRTRYCYRILFSLECEGQ
jgi:hypothetical protein